MKMRLILLDTQVFMLVLTDIIKDKQKTIPDILKYFVYESDYELAKSNLRFIKTEYRDFKLTHLYKYNKVFNVFEDGQVTILLVQKKQTNGSLTKHILQQMMNMIQV